MQAHLNRNPLLPNHDNDRGIVDSSNNVARMLLIIDAYKGASLQGGIYIFLERGLTQMLPRPRPVMNDFPKRKTSTNDGLVDINHIF